MRRKTAKAWKAPKRRRGRSIADFERRIRVGADLHHHGTSGPEAMLRLASAPTDRWFLTFVASCPDAECGRRSALRR